MKHRTFTRSNSVYYEQHRRLAIKEKLWIPEDFVQESGNAGLEGAVSCLKFDEPQSESLTTIMRGRLVRRASSKDKTVVLGGFKDQLKTIRRIRRRIVFVGCGTNTSYNAAALAARPILEELSGIDC